MEEAPELVAVFETQLPPADDREIWQFANFIVPLKSTDDADKIFTLL